MAYTNKTANYELPQYTPTDQPTYLEDFNGAMFTIDSGMKENSNNIGDLSSLTTTAKSSLVSAINEVNQNSGASLIGDLDSLTTTEKSTVVGAINEVDSNTDTNATAIGDLSTLTTTAKTDLVSAINEVASSSGGSCNVHFINGANHRYRDNAINFDTLEKGIHIIYASDVYSDNVQSIYFKRSTDTQASSGNSVTIKCCAMLVKVKDWADSTSEYDIIGYIDTDYFKTYSSTSNINKTFARFVKTSNNSLGLEKTGVTLLTTVNKNDIATGYNASKTQTLKNVNGTLTWVDDV